jgi:hypothetical protein
MDEMLLASLVALVSAMPGVVLGVALLSGLWKPASLAGASDPDGLRRKVGGMVLAIGTLVASLGLGLMLLPRAQLSTYLPWLLGAIGVAAIALTVVALRKPRS